MLLQSYGAGELHWAYALHVYYIWRTHRRKIQAPLKQLDTPTLARLGEPFGLHVLEGGSDGTQVRVLASLRPEEAVAACASKLKGQTSKWLRQALGLEQPGHLLARGYFAATSGKSTAAQVDQYLQGQGEHHGYMARPVPPVYLTTYEPSEELLAAVTAQHAWTVLHYHVVLAVWYRRGVFGPAEAEAVTSRWRELQCPNRFVLRKVSFLPDHVHVAVRLHPTVAPAKLVVELMNAAQEVIWQQFPDSAIQAKVERLWRPSAYVGSFGDLATPQVHQYLRNWEGSLD